MEGRLPLRLSNIPCLACRGRTVYLKQFCMVTIFDRLNNVGGANEYKPDDTLWTLLVFVSLYFLISDLMWGHVE